MGRVEERLREMGVGLATVPKPVANYVAAKRVGNTLYTAGQVSAAGGREYKGKVGADMYIIAALG